MNEHVEKGVPAPADAPQLYLGAACQKVVRLADLVATLVQAGRADLAWVEAERDWATAVLAGLPADTELSALRAERDKLQAFKDWVHGYLDAHGVPHHPPGPHGAEGCRIGDRLDWLLGRAPGGY